MDGVSVWQLLIIAVTVVLLSDIKRLDSIDFGPGALIRGFKKATSDDEPKQDKASQDADFTVKTTADKQVDMGQKQVKTGNAKRHDEEQV